MNQKKIIFNVSSAYKLLHIQTQWASVLNNELLDGFVKLMPLPGAYKLIRSVPPKYKTSRHPNRAYGTKQWFVLIQISKPYSLLCVWALITIIQFLCLLLILGSLANWNSVLSLPLLFQGNLTELPFQDLSGTAAKIMFDCFLIAVITVMDSDSELLYTFQ